MQGKKPGYLNQLGTCIREMKSVFCWRTHMTMFIDFQLKMVFNHFLKRTEIKNYFSSCLYMDFICPLGNTVLLKIDVIQAIDTLVQHLSCLEGF